MTSSDKKFKLWSWLVVYYVVTTTIFLAAMACSVVFYPEETIENTEIVFKKNGVVDREMTDSVVNKLYHDGKLDYFYDHVARNMVDPPADSLEVIKFKVQRFVNLDIEDFFKRYQMMNDELRPLGYQAYTIDEMSSLKYHERVFSHPGVVTLWAITRFSSKAVDSPICYILIPVAVIILIISPFVRKCLKDWLIGILKPSLRQ